MSELAKFLELVEAAQVVVNNKIYIHFSEDSGHLIKTSTSKETDVGINCIEVNPDDAKLLINGTHSMNDYRVLFDPEKKRHDLKFTTMSQEMFNPNVGKLFEITKTDSPDITITKDLSSKLWVIELFPEAIKLIKSDPVYKNTVLYFHITEQGDPHTLYRFLEVEVDQLLDEKVYFAIRKQEFELCSVYTTKFFDKYSFEVKK
jgi:hypothetical protein